MSTATQTVTDELRRWIIAQAEAGCRPEDVVSAMVSSGWDEEVAMTALETTLRERLDAVAAARRNVPSGVPVPEPTLQGQPAEVVVLGHRVKVLLQLRNPRVVVFGGLLSDEECDALVALSQPRLARSETVDNATGGSEINASRTSDGMFFERGETPLIDRIEQRLAALLNWPLAHGEGLQILRYRRALNTAPTTTISTPPTRAVAPSCSAVVSGWARW